MWRTNEWRNTSRSKSYNAIYHFDCTLIIAERANNIVNVHKYDTERIGIWHSLHHNRHTLFILLYYFIDDLTYTQKKRIKPKWMCTLHFFFLLFSLNFRSILKHWRMCVCTFRVIQQKFQFEKVSMFAITAE